MTTGRTAKEPAIGSREDAKARAKERAREEGVPIYVLRYRDRDRLYTASRLTALSQHPTECHGCYTSRGYWVPTIVLDVDDAIGLLRAHSMDEAAALIERVRGDKES